LQNTARRRRRDDVSGAQVPEDSDGDGPLPAREPRTVAVGRAVASRGAPAPHRRLDGSVAPGQEERRVHDGAIAGRTAGPLILSSSKDERISPIAATRPNPG